MAEFESNIPSDESRLVLPPIRSESEKLIDLKLEGLGAAEAQEILEILNGVDDKIDPRLLTALVQQIRKTGTSERLDESKGSGKKAAAWYVDRGEIQLFDDYFANNSGKTNPEYRRHILLHEVSHALIDAGLVDLAKLQEITFNFGSRLDPDWVARMDNGEDQEIERAAELLTSVWLENAGCGTVEEAVRQRLRRFSEKKQLEFERDPELMAQLVAETEKVFELLFNTFRELNVEEFLAQSAGKAKPDKVQPPIEEPTILGETLEVDQTNLDATAALAELLYFAGDLDDDEEDEEDEEEIIDDDKIDATEKSEKKKKEKKPKISEAQLDELAIAAGLSLILEIEAASLSASDNPLGLIRTLDEEIAKRRVILSRQPVYQKYLDLAERAQIQLERTPRQAQRSQQQKETPLGQNLLSKIEQYFRHERSSAIEEEALAGRCYQELRELESLKREIINRHLIKDIAGFYTSILNFSGESWAEILGGRYQRNAISFQNEKILMAILDEATLEKIIEYRQWAKCLYWAEEHSPEKKTKEKYAFNQRRLANYQVLRLLTVQLLTAYRADDISQVELLKHAYWVVIRSLSERGHMPVTKFTLYLTEPEPTKEKEPEEEKSEEEKKKKSLSEKIRDVFRRAKTETKSTKRSGSSYEVTHEDIEAYIASLLDEVQKVRKDLGL